MSTWHPWCKCMCGACQTCQAGTTMTPHVTFSGARIAALNTRWDLVPIKNPVVTAAEIPWTSMPRGIAYGTLNLCWEKRFDPRLECALGGTLLTHIQAGVFKWEVVPGTYFYVFVVYLTAGAEWVVRFVSGLILYNSTGGQIDCSAEYQSSAEIGGGLAGRENPEDPGDCVSNWQNTVTMIIESP